MRMEEWNHVQVLEKKLVNLDPAELLRSVKQHATGAVADGKDAVGKRARLAVAAQFQAQGLPLSLQTDLLQCAKNLLHRAIAIVCERFTAGKEQADFRPADDFEE